MRVHEIPGNEESFDNKNRMPVFFIAHGSPMNAIQNNPFTQTLGEIGKSLQIKPKAVLCISAHWLTRGTFVCTKATPEIIYDFSGFPDELYHVIYPAPSSPEMANAVMKLVPEIKGTNEWGLDHGCWSVMKHIFPDAHIPVFQLSIDYNNTMQYHFELGKKLKSLRNEGVLIIGSGNVVHNLRLLNWSDITTVPWSTANPFDWAVEFDSWVKDKIDKRDFESLMNYEKMGKAAKLAVPTVDHYVPLLYCLGMAEPEEKITYPFESIVFGSLSMRCVKIG
ncbi:MAG: 4,5-DOPA dioxygenase extradiol [FCB group bacterium]|jgi:4,5-DOPA dioxygenase extradiol